MKQVLFLLLSVIVFSGCYTQKKATEQVQKALNEYPEVAAKEIRDKFPCVSDSIKKSDSSEYKLWQKRVNDIVGFYEDLLSNVEPQIKIEKDLSDSMKVLILSENNSNLQRMVNILKEQKSKTNTIYLEAKPIHDTIYVRDMADIYLADKRVKDITEINIKLMKENSSLQENIKSKNTKMWLMLALIIALLVWTFRKLFGKLFILIPLVVLSSCSLPAQMQGGGISIPVLGTIATSWCIYRFIVLRSIFAFICAIAVGLVTILITCAMVFDWL